jgi:high-affinity K+ transport system ATPase subunit B
MFKILDMIQIIPVIVSGLMFTILDIIQIIPVIVSGLMYKFLIISNILYINPETMTGII